MRHKPLVPIVVALALIAPFAAAQGEAVVEEATVTEELLWQIPDGIKAHSLLGLPIGDHVGIWAKQGDQELIVTDGEPGEKYDNILYVLDDGSGGAALLVARQKGKFVVVEGEEVLGPYDEMGRDNYETIGAAVDERIVFTSFPSEQSRYALHVRRGKEWLVVLDGEEQPGYDETSGIITFSPDGKRVAYRALRGKKWVMVVDGEEGEEFDDVGILSPLLTAGRLMLDRMRWENTNQMKPRGIAASMMDTFPRFAKSHATPSAAGFSADGSHVFYAAKRGSKWMAVIDGEVGPEYDLIAGPFMSPDQQRICYEGKAGKAWRVVIDGEPVEGYDETRELAFSPDGERMAFCARRGKEEFVVVDGQELEPHKSVFGPVTFSPDGQRVAYVAADGKGKSVVVDGQPLENTFSDIVGPPLFSPDGQRVAYGGIDRPGGMNRAQILFGIKNGPKCFMVVDDERSQRYDRISFKTLGLFSDDSQHFAYFADPGKGRVIVDGELHPYAFGASVRGLSFGPGDAGVLYVGSYEERERMVMGGRIGPKYEVIDTTTFAMEDGSVQYLAIRDKGVYSVTQR